ncbi:MAG: hypothetical protein GQ535_03745 [Rhodobacteraceae bacterium]|nr:hypothetical protein [Paracoccaceae bacterium]
MASNIVLGAANFGLIGTAEDAFGAIHCALKRGICAIDVSPSYGGAIAAEDIVGACSSDLSGVKIFSKVLWTDPASVDHRASILASVEISLKRLRRSRLEIMFVEAVPDQEWAEVAWNTLASLVTDGTIGKLGVFYHDELTLPLEVQALFEIALGEIPIEISQNLVRRRRIDLAGNNALAYATAPLAGGLLTGKYSQSRGVPGRYDFYPDLVNTIDQARADILCRALSPLPGGVIGVALAWVLEQPRVCSTILGVRDKEQLVDCLNRLDQFRNATAEIYEKLEHDIGPQLGLEANT